jgi:chaperone modulatory protein CbpM
MIDVELLFARFSSLDPKALDRWISMAWVRPEIGAQGYLFREIDVARVALIRDLTDGMRVEEDTLPLVLSLLDQLYDARRRHRELGDAIAELASEELQIALRRHLVGRTSGPSDGDKPPAARFE